MSSGRYTNAGCDYNGFLSRLLIIDALSQLHVLWPRVERFWEAPEVALYKCLGTLNYDRMYKVYVIIHI